MPFVAGFFTAFVCAALRFRFAILERLDNRVVFRFFARKVRKFS
jgi:hypothetical protein